jgi:hypothetical protein
MMTFTPDCFVGGWFGIGRTYSAAVRFEWDSLEALKKDWCEALEATARWREKRGQKATGIHVTFQVASERIWEGIDFVKTQVLVPPHDLPAELQGLALLVYVLTPDGDHHFYGELYPWTTTPAK